MKSLLNSLDDMNSNLVELLNELIDELIVLHSLRKRFPSLCSLSSLMRFRQTCVGFKADWSEEKIFARHEATHGEEIASKLS